MIVNDLKKDQYYCLEYYKVSGATDIDYIVVFKCSEDERFCGVGIMIYLFNIRYCSNSFFSENCKYNHNDRIRGLATQQQRLHLNECIKYNKYIDYDYERCCFIRDEAFEFA